MPHTARSLELPAALATGSIASDVARASRYSRDITVEIAPNGTSTAISTGPEPVASSELWQLQHGAQQRTALARSLAELLPCMPEAVAWRAEKALAEVGVRSVVPDGEVFDAAVHHVVGTMSVDRPVRVIVAGSLKRGKSTLVNTLVGRPLLSPVGVDITTACWVEIGYGEEQATALIANAQSPGQPRRRPMLGALIQERTGRPPLTYGDPTTAVAQGAAQFAWKKLQEPVAPPPGPPPGPPVPEPPPDLAGQRSRQLRRAAMLAGSLFVTAALVTGIVLVAKNPTPTAPIAESSSAAPSTAPATTVPPSTSAPSTAPATTAPPTTAPALYFTVSGASQYPWCGREGTIHSAEGSPVSFAFVNHTSDPLQIIWIDGNGDRRTQGTLPGGETLTENAYSNQVWMIADASSNCLGIFSLNATGYIVINQ